MSLVNMGISVFVGSIRFVCHIFIASIIRDWEWNMNFYLILLRRDNELRLCFFTMNALIFAPSFFLPSCAKAKTQEITSKIFDVLIEPFIETTPIP